MIDKLLEVLLLTAPQLAGVVWAITYLGGKIENLTAEISALNNRMAVLLDRERVK